MLLHLGYATMLECLNGFKIPSVSLLFKKSVRDKGQLLKGRYFGMLTKLKKKFQRVKVEDCRYSRQPMLTISMFIVSRP